MAARTAAALEIRRLRKKLRQIENLERKDRDLTDEEILKIAKKPIVRDALLKLLAEQTEEDEENITSSTKSDTSYSQSIDDFSTSVHTDISESVPDLDLSNTEVTIISPENEESDDIVDVEQIDIEHAKGDNSPSKSDKAKGDNPFVTRSDGSIAEQEKTEIQNVNLKASPAKRKKEKESPVKSEKNSSLKTVVQKWRNSQFEVLELEGHSDLVTAVESDGKLLVSASRDTTVKVWDMEILAEIKNLGGHTSAVTSVVLLSKDQSDIVGDMIGCNDGGRIIVSGSTDCSFKIWSSNSGQAIRSTYTYNPVTKVVYHPVAQAIITGSDGGKLDVWDIETGENLQSLRAHEENVTGLQVSENLVYSSSADGILKVYEMRDKSLACVFVSENIQSEHKGVLTQRCIRGFMVHKSKLFYGDDGVNIKVLNWKTGLVHKISNHGEDFGITDCLCCHGNIFISSAYNLDTGLGYLNVRYLPEENYITSLNDEDTERIISVSCSEISNGRVAIVTAGLQLKVWLMCSENRRESVNDEDLIKARYITKLARRPEDSDVESDTELTDSDNDSDISEGNLTGRRGSSSSKKSQSSSWLSWCSLL